ncbi:MAG: hypothetical protein Fur0032_08610 [Terrimicrobiaceae bacterium]
MLLFSVESSTFTTIFLTMQYLTHKEIRLLAFIVLAALLGVAVQAWQARREVAPIVSSPSLPN